jgi:hypothetical protein
MAERNETYSGAGLPNDPITLNDDAAQVFATPGAKASSEPGPCRQGGLDLLLFVAQGMLGPSDPKDFSLDGLANFIDSELLPSPSRQKRKEAFAKSANGEASLQKRRRASQSSLNK